MRFPKALSAFVTCYRWKCSKCKTSRKKVNCKAQRLQKRLVSVLSSVEQSGHLDQDWAGIFILKK